MKVKIRAYSPDLIKVGKLEQAYDERRAKSLGISYYDYGEEHYNDLDRAIYWLIRRVEDAARPVNKAWRKLFPEKYDVKIDYADIWDAHITLSHIILPMLKELKKHKHGSPTTDPKDVPFELRPTEAAGPDNGYTDNTVHERWAWILDEMIWAFEQDTIDWEAQYLHNLDQLEMQFVPVLDEQGNKTKLSSLTFNDQKDPTKPKYRRDRKGIKAHHNRMKNGFRLFGKYYQDLWD